MKQKISHWTAMGFCACLSIITIPLEMTLPSTGWAITFLCFLPMCFFFVAAVTSNLQREVNELREQVAKLQDKQGG
jgi:hypothetical protein